jgi:lia operon protein LiaI
MKKFLLFVGGLVALIILLANLGPMVFLGLGIWLLYIVFKQFLKSASTTGKIGWIIVGLVLIGIILSNIYAVLGIVAAYALYVIVKNWKGDDNNPLIHDGKADDPFTNFEREWAELNH